MNESDDQIVAELGSLINASGKLRMLSHRAVMFGLLSACSEDDDASAELDATIREFAAITAQLTGDAKSNPLSPRVVDALRAASAVAGPHRQALERFLSDAKRMASGARCGVTADQAALKELALFVATDLLRVLNEINDGVRRALDSVAADRKSREASARRVIGESIGRIEKVSFAVGMIALNASVEAARAGASGRGFGVIANEIRQLSEDTSASVKDLREELAAIA